MKRAVMSLKPSRSALDPRRVYATRMLKALSEAGMEWRHQMTQFGWSAWRVRAPIRAALCARRVDRSRRRL
jgi:hypothetical protein